MRAKLLLIFATLMVACPLFGQYINNTHTPYPGSYAENELGLKLSVESVEALMMDLSASTSNRMDLAGKPCGLVKVVLPLQNVTFEGNVVGDVEFKSGEYWVFLSAGSKFLKVKHPQSMPVFIDLGNYDIQSIAGNTTYQIVIAASHDEHEVDVTFKVYPKNAILIIDQKEYTMVDGVAVVPLSPKEHNYVVVAYGYKTYGNKFQVYSDQINKIIIELDPADNGVTGSRPTPNRPATPVGSDYVEEVKGLDMKMVWVEGGEFRMGGTSEQGTDAYSKEYPVRQVKLDSYYIAETEVTQAQWEAVMDTSFYRQAQKAGATSYYGTGPNYPMYYVSWYEAQDFCRELSRLTGRTYVLPTEAQWEYAARGGKNDDGTKYSGSNSIGAVAWYTDNSGNSTQPVKSKDPNSLGLYDMSGNVWEWCSDWYGDYDANDTNNPTGPSSGLLRVLRGGSWGSRARGCRVSDRLNGTPGYRCDYFGFRVAALP